MNLAGKLSITSRSNGRVCIALNDEAACKKVLEVYVDYKEFAQALLGQGRVECELEFDNLDKLGKVQELKTETVFVVDKDVAASVAVYEVDGWVGDRDDATNHHQMLGQRKEDNAWAYKVTYRRWV